MYTPFEKGIISGIVSSVFCSPLDVLRTRYQISGESRPLISNYRKILKTEGSQVIKTGILSNVCCVPIWWGFYHHINNDLKQRGLPIGVDIFIAGNISSFITNPLFIMRTRMLSGMYNDHVIKNIFRIAKVDRMRSFTKGYLTTVGHNTQLCVVMPLFEWGKVNLTDETNYYYPLHIICISAISKLIGGTIFYPTEVIRARIRQNHGNLNLKEVFNSSFKPFSGYKAHALRSIPATVCALTTYELLK